MANGLDWKTLGTWVVVIAGAVGVYVSIITRIVSLEAGWVQERNGYMIAITAVNDRLNRIESKVDRLIERGGIP